MKISEVMNKAVVIEDDINLKEAAKIMSDRNIGSLVVINNDKITGIITEHDILKNVDSLSGRVSKFMTKTVLSIDKNDTLEHAAEIMAERKIKRIPVLDKGKLVGIVTATDVIAHLEEIEEDFFME